MQPHHLSVNQCCHIGQKQTNLSKYVPKLWKLPNLATSFVCVISAPPPPPSVVAAYTLAPPLPASLESGLIKQQHLCIKGSIFRVFNL